VGATTQELNGSVDNKAVAGISTLNALSEGGRLHVAIPQPARMPLSCDSHTVPASASGTKEAHMFVVNAM
jgi:hypothetical protein